MFRDHGSLRWTSRFVTASVVLLFCAWALNTALHLVVDVAPLLFGIAVVVLVAIVAYRIFQTRSSGW